MKGIKNLPIKSEIFKDYMDILPHPSEAALKNFKEIQFLFEGNQRHLKGQKLHRYPMTPSEIEKAKKAMKSMEISRMD